MATVNPWKRGSKSRLAQIRWTRWEIIHVVILTLLMAAFSVCVGIWVATHHID
jgi:hypothetical protein